MLTWKRVFKDLSLAASCAGYKHTFGACEAGFGGSAGAPVGLHLHARLEIKSKSFFIPVY